MNKSEILPSRNCGPRSDFNVSQLASCTFDSMLTLDCLWCALLMPSWVLSRSQCERLLVYTLHNTFTRTAVIISSRHVLPDEFKLDIIFIGSNLGRKKLVYAESSIVVIFLSAGWGVISLEQNKIAIAKPRCPIPQKDQRHRCNGGRAFKVKKASHIVACFLSL